MKYYVVQKIEHIIEDRGEHYEREFFHEVEEWNFTTEKEAKEFLEKMKKKYPVKVVKRYLDHVYYSFRLKESNIKFE